MDKLTQKQKNFISEYIKTLDGESALKKVGYKTTDYAKLSHEMLSDEKIITEIKQQLKCRINSLRVDKGYVIQKLLHIAEFSLEEEDILDKEGYPTGKRKLRDTSAALKALESLCKYLGFNTKEDNSYVGAKIITISNLDDKKI